MTGTSERAQVLVVEDDEDQLALMTAMLERAGCDVLGLRTAEDAIEELRRREPDVAIVDLLLPGIDGWELVSTMRDAVPECPVVIVSVLEERRFPPGVPSLPKPFTRDQLLAALEQAVPGRRWS
ncbi:response regulator [Rathayibacter sp. KR2-224]|uniref:response regulator n=1 Tax=Rathayibacter sp. KR2-224 TaxID=3400913 RepID=UPI003C08AFE3